MTLFVEIENSEAVAPVPPAVVSFEVVACPDDFFIALNDVSPSECTSFAINDQGGLEFSMADGSTVCSWPLPPETMNIVAAQEAVLFVQFGHGAPCDAKVLPQMEKGGANVCC